MSEQRGTKRSRTLLPARIDIAELGTDLACTIRDLSETGARLQVPAGVTIPATFRMHVPRFDRWVRANLKWRRGNEIGVEFESEAEDTADTPVVKDHRHAEKLERELLQLKQLLEAIREDPSRARLLLEKAA